MNQEYNRGRGMVTRLARAAGRLCAGVALAPMLLFGWIAGQVVETLPAREAGKVEQLTAAELCRQQYGYVLRGEEKYITLMHVACAHGAGVVFYPKVALYFDKKSGAFLRLEATDAMPTQAAQYAYESMPRLYYSDYFCDLERRTEPRVHWFDYRTGTVYEVKTEA